MVATSHEALAKCGGGGGIRTHGTLAGTHAFQACTLGRYVTPPRIERNYNSKSYKRQVQPPLLISRSDTDGEAILAHEVVAECFSALYNKFTGFGNHIPLTRIG